MLSEEDLKNQYISRNINEIIQNIQNNDYDYCGDHHDELKAILNYLLLLTVKYDTYDTYSMLDVFTGKVENIVLDDNQVDMVINLDFDYILIFANSSMNPKLEDRIIATGDAYYIYKYALEVKGASIQKLENAILASGDNKYIYSFARDIEGANIKKLENAILASSDAEYIYLFARDVNGASIEKLEDALILTANAEYIYYFATEVKGANISRLEDAIIRTCNAEYIYYFATNVKGANIEKLEDAVIATKNAEYIYYFAKDVKNANIEKLEDAVIATNNAEYIYKFADNIKGANKEKLLHAIINTQNEHYTALLMELIQDEINKDLESPKNPEEEALTLFFSSITEKTNLGSYLIELKLPVRTRKKFIDYLFANMEKGNNYLILRVYLEMLGKRRISSKKAIALDLEYVAALKEQEASTVKSQNPIFKIKRILDNDDI